MLPMVQWIASESVMHDNLFIYLFLVEAKKGQNKAAHTLHNKPTWRAKQNI